MIRCWPRRPASPTPRRRSSKLKVCDPACGSGHFLIAAAHRIAKKLAAVRTGDEEPAPEDVRHAIRDVIGHCIYGVDINPMAVELCKVALWMEALEPGKPLSFLEHHIQCGNSLLGATPALLKRGIPDEAFEPIEGDDKATCRDYRKQNKDERTGGQTMFDLFAKSEVIRLSNVGLALARIESMRDDSIETIHAKEQAYRELKESAPYEYAGQLADAWCAAFVIPKTPVPPLRAPGHADRVHLPQAGEQPECRVARGEGRDREAGGPSTSFFHWHLAFPNVFQPRPSEEIEDETSWAGTADSTSCWAIRRGSASRSRSRSGSRERGRILPRRQCRRAAQDDPALRRRTRRLSRLSGRPPRREGESHIVRNSGRFPLCGRGDVNTYTLFAEMNRQLIVLDRPGRLHRSVGNRQ